MKLLNETKDAIYIDNSILDWWRSCGMKCYYEGVLGLRLREHTPATYFGTMYHEGQHALWGGFNEKPWDIDRALDRVKGFDLAYEDEKKGRTFKRLKNALIDYAGHVDESTGESFRETMENCTTLLAEEFLTYEIMKWHGKSVMYCGVMDRAFNLNNKNYVMDYKTTTWNRVMDAKWAESPQFKGYLWLWNSVSPSLRTNEFVLDMFQMQAKTINKFFRRIMHFPDWMLEEWRLDRIAEITALLSCERPIKEPSCSDFGDCPFVSLCKQPPELRLNLAKQMYKVKPWDMHGNIKVEVKPLNRFLNKGLENAP